MCAGCPLTVTCGMVPPHAYAGTSIILGGGRIRRLVHLCSTFPFSHHFLTFRMLPFSIIFIWYLAELNVTYSLLTSQAQLVHGILLCSAMNVRPSGLADHLMVCAINIS